MEPLQEPAVEGIQLRQLLADVPSTIYVLSVEGGRVVLLWASENLRRVLGYDLDQVREPGFFERHLHPDDAPHVADGNARLRRNGQAVIEYRFRRHDGEYRWIRDGQRLLHDADAPSGIIVGSWSDITDSVRAEQALKESEERFRALTEYSTDLVVVMDAESIIRFATPSLSVALDRPLEEIVGSSAFDFVHPEDVLSSRRAFGDMLANPGASVILTSRVVRPDGSDRVLHISGQSLFHVPAVSGLVIHARDVTEQRRLEQQIVATQKLESIGRLAGGVAHDFNNLLTAILGYVSRLEASARNPEDARAIDGIRRAAERAGKLTHQLLAFARKQVMTPRALDLNALVEDSEDMLRRLLGEDLEILVELAPDLPPVKADPAQVEQILLNLTVNARDAMPAGGRIRIATAEAEVHAREVSGNADARPGRYVVLTVADSGIGMPPEILEHIFEPFYTTKAPGRGTGLGLATVYGIARQSGGWISVSSAPGAGSTFRVFLPRAESAPAHVPAERSRADGGGETVLLVEDDPVVRELERMGLENAGFRVIQATSGEDALRLIDVLSDPPDLLVTDVVMPGMHGTTLAERFRARHPEARVLLVSGYAETSVVTNGEMPPRTAFLAKPFSWRDLAARAREILDL